MTIPRPSWRRGASARDAFAADFDPDRWEQQAAEAEDGRDWYFNMLAAELSVTPEGNVEALAELLRTLCELRGAPVMFPSVQQDFHRRARQLFSAVVEATLPNRREGARLPQPATIATLVREARYLISKVKMGVLAERGKSQARTRVLCEAERRLPLLIGHWVNSRLPLSATAPEIDKRKKECLEVLRAVDPKKPVDGAIRLVAALLDTTPGMVLKVRKKVASRPGRRVRVAGGAEGADDE